MSINYLDITVVVIFILFIARGALQGFIKEFFGFIAIFVGIFFARSYTLDLAPYMEKFFPEPMTQIISFVTIVLVVMLFIGIIAKVGSNFMEIVFAGWLDAFLGALFGFAKAVLICAALVFGLDWFFKDAVFIEGSATLPYLMDVADYFTSFLRKNL